MENALRRHLAAVMIGSFVLLCAAKLGAAQTETVLYTFGDHAGDGAGAIGALALDNAGNLYGTTIEGGGRRRGVAFELTPLLGGGWSEGILHPFAGGTDGNGPLGNLIFDAKGNLYGVTEEGGHSQTCPFPGQGCGTVIQLAQAQSGSWKERVLYVFPNGSMDGIHPQGGLVFDDKGHLYGTTNEGGSYGAGTVFQLTPSQSGAWKENILYSFTSGNDGSQPVSGLVMDRAGNLYGTTCCSGAGRFGTVFEISPSSGGAWVETTLFSFPDGAAGGGPYGGVILDSVGNLYGTTVGGGSDGFGIVYELTPTGSGGWTENVLYSFKGGSDGEYPDWGVIPDDAGNLYGITPEGGGLGNCNNENIFCGTVFELTPTGSGIWTETLLYSFSGGTDGGIPQGGLILDSSGKLYGTTVEGGDLSCGIGMGNGCGVVFELQ